MTRVRRKAAQPGGIRTLWLWIWAAASALYAIPVVLLVVAPVPDEQQVKRLWIYDSLALVAEHRGESATVADVKSLFPYLSEDQMLVDLDKYWAAESKYYSSPRGVEFDFVRRVRELNAFYRARLRDVPHEREQARIAGVLAWTCPVTAALLGLWLAGHRRQRRARTDSAHRH